MKRKPIIIGVYVIAAAIISFFAFKYTFFAKPGKAEVITFLKQFNQDLQNKTPDSLLKYFENKHKAKIILNIIYDLQGRSKINGKDTTAIIVKLDVEKSNVFISSSEKSEITIPVTMSYNNDTRNGSITFKLRRISKEIFKIIQFDAKKFLPDFLALESEIKEDFLTDEQKYSPQTLAAFKIAAELKGRYDTIMWFTHIKNQTYFYVGKNKTYQEKNDDPTDSIWSAKMGLLNPDLKEIIPPEYDLIHNIGGTFQGLIEVEKKGKRGFYNLYGKEVVPVEYDQIFPLENSENLSVLRKGDDYFYLKKDTTVSEKVNLKVAEFISKIKWFGNSYVFNGKQAEGITEYNSREENSAIYICPSYLVDLNMVRATMINFKNPLRPYAHYYFDDINYDAKLMRKDDNEQSNWIKTAYYYVMDHFLGDRSDLYTAKQIVVADEKRNRVFGIQMSVDYTGQDYGDVFLSGICNENSIKMLNDSLYEVKTTAAFSMQLYNKSKVDAGPYYHYIQIKDGKLSELPDKRNFNFTKYVKMNDSYLSGCYEMNKKPLSHVTTEMLHFMKNEIYASYRYHFKDKRWIEIFNSDPEGGDLYENLNNSVDDSLTAIDKYNINWIDQRLKVSARK